MDADKKGGRRYVDEEEAGSSASHGISSSSWSDTSFPNCVKCMTGSYLLSNLSVLHRIHTKT